MDFAYLLRCFIGSDLPPTEIQFFELLQMYFVNFYDVKEMKRELLFLQGGLSKVAKELSVNRVGTMHQAGSDSIVTSGVFFTLQNLLIAHNILSPPSDLEDAKKNQIDSHMAPYNRVLYGLMESTNEDTYLENYKMQAVSQKVS